MGLYLVCSRPMAAKNRPAPLDPSDWSSLRAQGHRMLDDMLDYVEHIRERPVWQPVPETVRARASASPPPDRAGGSGRRPRRLHAHVLPYADGQHPSRLHGLGAWRRQPVGMLAEMLAAGLNANLGGRDHMPIEVERQIDAWVRELFDFPETATRGSSSPAPRWPISSACCRADRRLGAGVTPGPAWRRPISGWSPMPRRRRMAASRRRWTSPASAPRACGSCPTDEEPPDRPCDALAAAIAADRAAGGYALPRRRHGRHRSTSAPSTILRRSPIIAEREKLWFHVDGAFGALAVLAPDIAPRLAGIERGDSIALRLP